MTDELCRPAIGEVQTQSSLLGNWNDKQIQLTVLVPFHFVPGRGRIVTPNNRRVRIALKAAAGPYSLGIALHALQDSYSHQGFTGWEEPLNACQGWWYLRPLIPNIGHADMGVWPDVANIKWTDPRSGKLIDNRIRAMQAAKATWKALTKEEFKLEPFLKEIFLMSYEDRKKALIKRAPVQRYKKVKGDVELFIRAARKHLSVIMDSL